MAETKLCLPANEMLTCKPGARKSNTCKTPNFFFFLQWNEEIEGKRLPSSRRNPAMTTNANLDNQTDVIQVEAVPPRGRLGFDLDHIAVHHLRLNQNVESTKSLDQMWSPKTTKGARGENGRQEGEIPKDKAQAKSLSTVSGGRRKEDLEACRRSPRLCGRISLAEGPAIRWRRRGSRLTGWGALVFFFNTLLDN